MSRNMCYPCPRSKDSRGGVIHGPFDIFIWAKESFLRSLLLELLLNLQFILYFECAGHTSCRHICELAVTLIQHDPFQGDMTVLHDNVDWRNRLRTVSKERRIEAIDRAVKRDSQFVVHRRKRQHLNVVDNAAY